MSEPLTKHTPETFQANINTAYNDGWNAALEAAADKTDAEEVRASHVVEFATDGHEITRSTFAGKMYAMRALAAAIRALKRKVTP